MSTIREIVPRYSNKSVRFRFDGSELTFRLSQALFSSFDIDKGTKLLLSSLPRHIDFARIYTVFDLGCGVGPLGLTLKNRHPHLQVLLQDRDALAAAFAEVNAHDNGLESGTRVLRGIGYEHIEENSLDLLLSNIPAKAGAPVLSSFIKYAAYVLKPGATAAFVIVRPLSDFIYTLLLDYGAEIDLRMDETGHSVFHVRFSDPPVEDSLPSAPSSPPGSEYFRGRVAAAYGRLRFNLDTVYGLADFDTPPKRAHLLERLLRTFRPESRALVWSPGQGYLPLLIHHSGIGSEVGIDCAGRDGLALAISRHNLPLDRPGETYQLASPLELPEWTGSGYDLIVAEVDRLPANPLPEELLQGAEQLLETGGILFVLGRSADINPFFRASSAFKTGRSYKHQGYRSLILQKK